MKADQIIEKFGLRDLCVVNGVLGQKMDEGCIQRFVENDPSKTGKYLEWMLYQAGGGVCRLDRSTVQWENGEHKEPALREQLKAAWIEDLVKGYKDDNGVDVPPISQEEAEKKWAEDEPALKRLHIYGDEDYVQHGCFGFYRNWPGRNNLYPEIVKLVERFHRHRAALKAQGKSIDLSLKTYPNLPDLAKALENISAAEIRAIQDYDVIFKSEWLLVSCPYTVGASLRLGIPKWCTSNESGFLSALSGGGKNRWKEYAEHHALYYCRFRKLAKPAAFPVDYVAIQVPFCSNVPLVPTFTGANYWDADDKSSDLNGWLAKMTRHPCMTLDHVQSFKDALQAMIDHFKQFPKERLVLNFGI